MDSPPPALKRMEIGFIRFIQRILSLKSRKFVHTFSYYIKRKKLSAKINQLFSSHNIYILLALRMCLPLANNVFLLIPPFRLSGNMPYCFLLKDARQSNHHFFFSQVVCL